MSEIPAVLCGSRAKGNFRPGSDIDLTLRGPRPTAGDPARPSRDLDDLLLPDRIDLSLHHQIDTPDLLVHIERLGQVLYEKEHTP